MSEQHIGEEVIYDSKAINWINKYDHVDQYD